MTVTLVTEDGFPLGIFQAEVIWGFLIPVAMPRCGQRAYSTLVGQILLGLGRPALFVLPGSASLDIFKILANVIRETESRRVLLLE